MAKGSSKPTKRIETVPNPYPGREYNVNVSTNEFTTLCPMTGQPDFATITIDYVPGEKLVELKSLKLYFWSYRDQAGFHEDVTNRILDDLVAACQPRSMTIEGKFNVRGGLQTIVRASYPADRKG